MNNALPSHTARYAWLRQLRPWLMGALFVSVAFEFPPMPRAIARMLRFYLGKARFIAAIFCVLAANERVSQPNADRRAPRRIKPRFVIGSRFRRMLKGRTPREAIENLIALIDAPERFIRYFERRFRRGFTRKLKQPPPARFVARFTAAGAVLSAAPPFT